MKPNAMEVLAKRGRFPPSVLRLPFFVLILQKILCLDLTKEIPEGMSNQDVIPEVV